MRLRTPVIVGLSAAAGMALVVRPNFRPLSLPLNALPPIAVMYVLTVFLASAVALLVTYFVESRPDGFYQIALRTAAAAVWMAPLSLLFYWRSLWAMVAVVALVASLAGLWDTFEKGDTRRFVSALGVSTCLQLALVAALVGYPRVAALMAGVSAAVFLWVRPERERNRFTLPRAMPRILLAIILTAIALTPFLKLSPGGDDLLAALLGGGAGGHPDGAKKDKPAQTQVVAGGEFPGVILWPDQKPRTMLVPPPPSIGRGQSLGSRPKPMVIPFDGAYWFFRFPSRSPPKNSFVTHGTTMKTVFRSVDHTKLAMEAHQNFGGLMDLGCCSRIEIVIDSASPADEGVWLELVLLNTTLDGLPSLSLGKVAVGPGFEQALGFAVPRNSVMQKFDEVSVRFHRDARQWEKSAKIAIVRFVLVP